MISALNILNETEINYKAARNKRLHVELAIIKLCYLQQAIELVNDPGGSQDRISKKKRVEVSKPIAFRKIEPIELSQKSETKTQQAKLIIESAEEEKIVLQEESKIYKKENTDKELQNAAFPNEIPQGKTQSPNTKLAALDKIRNTVQRKECMKTELLLPQNL